LESTWPPDRPSEPVKIERIGKGDAKRVMDAGQLFDDPPRKDAVARFLSDPSHHLLIAYLRGDPVGFVSGVEVTHPDKGTEMFLYELAVDSGHRHHGIGTRTRRRRRHTAKRTETSRASRSCSPGGSKQRRRLQPGAGAFALFLRSG
jgi:GNAT superfamily N-acetyltransferase